jgi:hypothetical protein
VQDSEIDFASNIAPTGLESSSCTGKSVEIPARSENSFVDGQAASVLLQARAEFAFEIRLCVQ